MAVLINDSLLEILVMVWQCFTLADSKKISNFIGVTILKRISFNVVAAF